MCLMEDNRVLDVVKWGSQLCEGYGLNMGCEANP